MILWILTLQTRNLKNENITPFVTCMRGPPRWPPPLHAQQRNATHLSDEKEEEYELEDHYGRMKLNHKEGEMNVVT